MTYNIGRNVLLSQTRLKSWNSIGHYESVQQELN